MAGELEVNRVQRLIGFRGNISSLVRIHVGQRD